jgi:hypothetical protein
MRVQPVDYDLLGVSPCNVTVARRAFKAVAIRYRLSVFSKVVQCTAKRALRMAFLAQKPKACKFLKDTRNLVSWLLDDRGELVSSEHCRRTERV